jgi:CHAD domain-containing protein
MKKWLSAYLKNEEQEDLHQFRVQVKKLQAFLILNDQAGHHRELLPYFRPVKKLFKCAGELRNAHISGGLTHTTQQDFRSSAVKHWKNAKKAGRTLKRKIRGIKNKSVERFYRCQLRQIGGMLAALPSDDQLHDCRKMIKSLLYNEQLVHDVILVRLNTAYLDTLQEAIGNWHDQLLTAAPSGHSTGALKEAIGVIIADFSQRATAG